MTGAEGSGSTIRGASAGGRTGGRAGSRRASGGRGGSGRSAEDHVYTVLRTEIEHGLEPGTPLRLSAIAERLGVSTMPVRAALKRLEGDGLVRVLARRGTVVAPLELDDIEEIQAIRWGIEGLAARLGAEACTDADVAAMRGHLERIREASAARDMDAYLDATYDKYDSFVLDTTPGSPTLNQRVPISFAGMDLQNAPKWSGGASISWTFPAGPGEANVFLQDNYTSSKFTYYDDAPQNEVGAINLVNATIKWTTESARWAAAVYARNLMDRKYGDYKLYLPVALYFSGIRNPREFGVTLNLHC